MQIFLFFVPGILLLLSKTFKEKLLTEALVYIGGGSLAFFVVAPWFLKFFSFPLLLFSQMAFFAILLLLFLLRKKLLSANLALDRNEVFLLLIFIFIIVLRCLPVFLQLAPAGGDMSMHAYIARLIYDNNGLPSSYEPILPIKNFGAYPTGFPTLSAIISLLGGSPVFRSALLLACLTHAFICFALYAFLLRFCDRNTAAATAIAATFLTRSPQWIIRWGGNPTVLALAFFVLAFALIIETKEHPSWLKTILASLFLAATLITHTIIFYTGAIVLAVYLLFSIKGHKNILTLGTGLFFFTALLLAPYLLSLKFTLSPEAVAYSKNWQLLDFKSVVYDFIAGIPFLALSLTGLFMLFREKKKLAIVFLTLTAIILILIANHRFWLIPFSCLLYPGRVALFLIIPLSLFASPVIAKTICSSKKYLATILLIIGFLFYSIFYLYNSMAMCAVTQADLDAFRWMDKNIKKTTVIRNNYGDAGLWIPAIIGRPITHPHSFAVFYDPTGTEGFKKSSNTPEADYLYIGRKAVYPIELKSRDLEEQSGKYTVVYNKDGAGLWKTKN